MITDLEADKLADEYPNASPERKPQIETALRTWVTAAEAEAADRAREGAARLRQSFKSVSDLGGLWTKEQELRLPPTDNPDEVKARVANTAFLAEAGGMDYETAAKTYEGLRARWAQATLGKKDAGDLEMYAEVSRQYQDGEDKAKLAFQRDADAAARGFQRALEGAPPDWSTPEFEWRKGAEKAPGFDASWGFGLEQSVAYRDAFQRAFKVATEHRPLVLETLDTLKRGTKWINQGAGLSEEAAVRLMELTDAERADVLRAIVSGAASMSPEAPGAAVSNLQKVFKNMGISASRGLDALRLSKVSQALSAADAASALEAIKDGKPVYDLGGGKIATSLAAVQGAFGLEVSMQAAEPVPASEIPALTKKLEGTLKFFQITNQLEQVARQYLDPIRPAYKTGPGWVAETMAVGLAGSAPQMVAGAIPGVGLPWMTASFVDSAYERIVADQPDIDPRSALAMATVAGTIEGGIEMLQIRNAIGLLPATSKLVQAIRTPNVKLFKALGIQLGANIAEQNLEEALQDLALPTVKAIGAALNKDIEGVNLAQEWQEFGGTRLETFLSVLPLAILGAGAAGIRETTAFRNLLASEQALVEYGLPREVAASIAAQETPEARQAVFFEEQSKRTPESIRAGIAEAEARVARETVAATSNETPTMVYEGGKFRIVEPDGSSSMAFDDPETASLALQSRNEWEESGAAVAVRELADWLGMRDSDKRKWEVVPKIVTLEDDTLATPEQIAERMRLAGLEGLAPSEAQVFGQNVTEVRDGMVRVVNSVFVGSNPLDVVEEEGHFRFRQEMDAGTISREQAEAAVRAFQGDRAPQTFSDQALDEGVAEMVRAYFAGNTRFIRNLPQSVRAFFVRMAVFFRDAFRNAAKLKKLIRDGKIDANWVAFLNRSVGLTEALQEQEAAAKAAQDLTGKPAEIVTRFSVGKKKAPKEEPVIDERHLNLAPAEYIGGRGTVSTRVPTAKKAVESEEVLHINLEAINQSEELKAKLAQNLRDGVQEGGRSVKYLTDEQAAGTDDEVIRHFIDLVKSNLLWLWDKFPEEYKERAKLWYVGANKIAEACAEFYGVTVEQAAGVLAVESPQKDWFQNVSMAERIMRIWKRAMKEDFVFTQERFDYCYNNDVEEVRAIAESEFKPRIFKPKKWSKRSGVSEEEFNASEEQRKKDHRKKERERKSAFLEKREEARVEFNKKNAKWEAIRPRVIGKPWSQLDYDGKARLFRALDEMEGDRSYRIILPEGGRGEIALTSKGEPAVVAWSSYNFIAKAFSILDDGSLENISRNLGEEHKVRNFFNNISDPHNVKGYVTIDTHAIAAALLNSLSGTSKEVKDNFGAAGGDSFVGVGGTYGIYATAYKELADELSRILGRQVLAREVQSVTWEAVRLLFTKEQKTSGKLTQQLDALWNEHAEGKAGIDDVRRRIWDLSGGIQPPSWANTEFGYDAKQSGLAGSVLDGGPFIPLGRRAGGADSSMDPREGSLQQEGVVRGSNPAARFSVGRKAAPYAEQLTAQMDALKTKPTVRIQIYERAKKKFRELVERNRAAIAEAQAADTRKPAEIIEEAKATHDAEVARIDEERDAALAAATTDKQRNTARLVYGTKLRAANMALSKALAAATGEGTRQARTAQVVGELNAILSAFPAEVRGRVGGFVQLVQRKTEKAFGKILSERIAKAEAELERLLKREYIERIDSTLERLEPKLSEGKVQSSNLGPEAQAYVDAVAAVVNMSEDEVIGEIARLEGLIESETEPDKLAALVTRLEIANQYGNLEERTSAELASALENLQVVARGGREKWKIQEEARKEANKATAIKILERLGFKNGRKPQDSDIQNAKERARTFAEGAIDFVESNLSWPQTLQEVFKSAKDEVALYFEDLARKSTNALTDSLVKVSNRFNSEMNSRLGVKNRRERLKVLARLSETKNTGVDFLEGRVVVQEKIDIETARRLVAGGPVLGEFTLEEVKLIGNLLAENDAKPQRRQKKSLTFDRVLSEGEATPQRMTELEAVQYLLSWAQPDIRPRMERQGIGQNAIDGLEKFISKEARAIMGFLQEEYARGYTRLNEVYRRLFGMNMPRVENYSPARYDVAGADTDVGGPLDMGGGEGAGMSSGFVKTRQKHNARLARVDALSTYFQHVQNSEYWMAWAENVREMKATLGRTEVLQAIRSKAGLGKEEAVKKWVKAFETNGRKDAAMFSVVTKLLNSVMAAHSKIALAWKFAVLMKQASAALGSTMELPPGAAVSGWGRFMSGKLVIGLKDVWNSPTIQRRIESGFSPEVRTAMATDGLSPSMLASLGEKGMLPIIYTDAAFTTISAAIAYDYHYRKAVDSGVSPEAAKEVAMDAMDRTIHRTAQPAENVDRSLNEVNASVWAKLLMQFKSEARKNFAISYLAAKRIGRGEDVASNAKTLAVSWALGGVLTQTMGDLYRSIFKDDDDEDLWQPEDYMRAMVLGPIDGLFLIGPALNGFLTWLTGGKVFQGKPANPVEQAIGDMRRKGANPANWEGWQDTYSGMLLWIQTLARLTGSKTMTGVGALGNAGKTLVELAEE